jgi:hypothetical protein
MAGCPRRVETYDQKTGRSGSIWGSARSPRGALRTWLHQQQLSGFRMNKKCITRPCTHQQANRARK